MKETFASLLAQPDVRMPHLSAAMASMLAKRIAGGDAPAQPSVEDAQSVERLLHRIFSVDDVIYKMVSISSTAESAMHCPCTILIAILRVSQ